MNIKKYLSASTNFHKFFLILSIAIFGALLLPKISLASWSVWTEDLLIDKIRPDYNPDSKPSSITIKGAKNEWVAFQIVALPSGENASNFVPSVQSPLINNEGNIIDTSNFVFYIINYHKLDSSEVVYGLPGDWPDACVPYKDRWYNETRNGPEAGWGQTVIDGRAQPFLIELYIPENAIPGDYKGLIRLTADGSLSGARNLNQDIEINLTVWNFSLPSQWSLTNLWGATTGYWEFDTAAFGGRNDTKAREWLFRMAQSGLDHGIFFYSSSGRFSDGAKGTTPTFVDSNFVGSFGWKKFLDGTASQNYNPKPYKRTSVFSTRSSDGFVSWTQNVSYLDNWATWIIANGYNLHTIFVDKFADEPHDVSSYVSSHNTRHNGYPNRPYEFYTASISAVYPPNTGFWSSSYKQLWCVKDVYSFYRPFNWGEPFGNPSDFNDRKSRYGDILWLYFAGDSDRDAYNFPPTRTAGSPMIDAYARQNAFIALENWVFKATGIHYWTVNYNWARTTDQVWEDVSPFGAHYNGDGIYFYPGRPNGSNHDIGGVHEIPIESLRLKLFRWGAQIYEYANLLKIIGKSSVADTQIANMITFNIPNGITIHSVDNWNSARDFMASEIAGNMSLDTIPPAAPAGLSVI